MKFKSIFRKARVIDSLIEQYIKSTNALIITLDAFGDIVQRQFPEFTLTGRGAHKVTFTVHYNEQTLVLKVGKKDTIENDHRVYKLLPRRVRHAYHARIFWHTKHCLLQEYGVETEVSEDELNVLRTIMGRYGLIDIRCDNIRKVNGRLKVVDANIAEGRTAHVKKILDRIRVRLPW